MRSTLRAVACCWMPLVVGCSADPGFEVWSARAYEVQRSTGAGADAPSAGAAGAPALPEDEGTDGAPASPPDELQSAMGTSRELIAIVAGSRGGEPAQLWFSASVTRDETGRLLLTPTRTVYVIGEPRLYTADELVGRWSYHFGDGRLRLDLRTGRIAQDELGFGHEAVVVDVVADRGPPLVVADGSLPHELEPPTYELPARLRPRRLEPVPGEEPPAGYRAGVEPIWGLLIGGLGAVSLTYVTPLALAGATGFGGDSAWLGLPIAGPIVIFARYLDQLPPDNPNAEGPPRWYYAFFVGTGTIGLSLLQLGSFGALTAGIAVRRPVWRSDGRPLPAGTVADVRLLPIVAPGYAGWSMTGSF